MLPIVAIVGKENVGKSTLFNKLVGARAAVTHSLPGTTRDSNAKEFEFWGAKVLLVDTGGYVPCLSKGIKSLVKGQIESYIQRANLILFIADITSGITPIDLEISNYIRKLGKDIILVVNKVDNKREAQDISEFYELGFKEIVMISAMHSTGIDILLDKMKEIVSGCRVQGAGRNNAKLAISNEQLTMNYKVQGEEDRGPRFAILGRPNVGKSTYVNSLIREPRMIVHEQPGTTIDSIDVTLEYKDKKVILIDTPGLRRRAKMKTDLEYYSSVRTNLTISRCDVGLLLIDATMPLTHQDKRLISILIKGGKGVVVAGNKIDLGVGFNERALGFAKFIPVSYISALRVKGIYEPFEKALLVSEARKMRISKRKLGQFVQTLKKVKINSMVQIGIEPPRFRINTNKPLTHTSLRSLENQLREHFGFIGAPIYLKSNQ